jgi:phospholipase C
MVILMMENHSYDNNYLGTLAGRGDDFSLADHEDCH